MVSKFLKDFFRLESLAGIVIISAAILALIVENSGFKALYDLLRVTPMALRVGDLELSKPLLLWINDALMTVVFFLIGLELKREIMDGELSTLDRLLFPALGAIGGMVVPALIYAGMTWTSGSIMIGWTIPSVMDLAFCLAVLSLLGDRVPSVLKVFLTTVAIFDNVGVILIISGIHAGQLSTTVLAVSGCILVILFVMNRLKVESVSLYVAVGVLLWVSLLQSGVHSTLAGVLLAFFIPMQNGERTRSPLQEIEQDLHPAVSYGLLPLFAFANSGVAVGELFSGLVLPSVPLGIALGLVLGKQLGVFGLCWIGVKARVCSLPAALGWKEIYGASMLCGIGFTMSFFVGSLAAEQGAPSFERVRVGILWGSLVSAGCGYFFLRHVLSQRRNKVLPRA